MATIISASSSKATRGEKRVARILARLPDDWIVYYEPRVKRGDAHLQPDFIVLAPAHGLLVLEVKDWTVGFIHSLNGTQFTLRNEGAFWTKNPLDQVRSYWRAMKDACRRDDFGRDLVAADGSFEGQLCFPVGAAVVFSHMSAAEVHRSEHSAAWSAIFTPTNSLLVDQLREWEMKDEKQLAAALLPFFQPFRMQREFTARQIDALRWVLFPETHMDVVLGQKSQDRSRVLEVLDAKQEQQARALGDGHRILFGVAGSGKTVLLMARARWIASEHPERRCLLLCYNKVLAHWLSGRLADCPSVKVRHFDAWAIDLGVTRENNEKNESFGRRLLAHLGQQGEAARTLDAAFIDEAQDFEPTWFQCVLGAVKDPKESDLVIVADGCQSLYDGGPVSWKSIGIRAQGRSISARYDLNRNYRNTPEIAELAAHYGSEEPSEDGVAASSVSAARCRRTGSSVPVFVEADDRGRQCEAALEIVARWLSGGYRGGKLRPEEIGILYPGLMGRERPEFVRFLAQLSNLAPTKWLSDREDYRAHEGVNDTAIKVHTIHAAKGLQYRAVILLWTDLLEACKGTEGAQRRLLYVAITRAESELVLLGSGSRGATEDLKQHCRVRHYPFWPENRAVA